MLGFVTPVNLQPEFAEKLKRLAKENEPLWSKRSSDGNERLRRFLEGQKEYQDADRTWGFENFRDRHSDR